MQSGPRAANGEMIFVAVVAFVARISYWALVTPNWVPQSDADQYVLLARAMKAGHGFALVYPQLALHATAFRPPLYPVLLLPAVTATNGLWAARLTSVLIGTAVAVAAALVARRVAGPSTAWFVGVTVSLYPPLLANDTVTLTEPLGLLLVLVLVLLVDSRRWICAAAICGALLLTRPNAYLVVVVLVVLAYRAVGWKTAVAVLGLIALCIAPWSIRNQVQVGTPHLVTSDSFTLAAIFATPAQAEGDFVDPVFDTAYAADYQLKLSQFDEPTWDSELTSRAWDGIKSNPLYVAENAGRNVLDTLELRPRHNEAAELSDGRNLDFRRATLFLFYVVTAVGLVGLWRYRTDPRVRLLAVIAGQFVVVAILILSPPRLRAPFDLACAIGFGLALDDVVSRRRTAKM